ncbi:3-deoxy-D-manno-octulosonic acid transferase [Thalassobius vesicularis]|uniref:3-deoxy-D-manno-octulosonic acid transferase n=1 Tax=Thalassobius vesicularis TaxID=1294297 RepID=A0A4S3M5S2_9RHOB|nr:glycosyltransferase N-terminal domain-containing protein [Thalassobius vesicularis]THD71606.1 3-deoxy-D-manno-octulosonic acid transferase [Thalassobius vesicularis]
MSRFPSLRMRLFLAGWALLWGAALPLILLYIRKRAKRDPMYGTDLAQRFGRHRLRWDGSVWVHTVSIGEFRSAVPLIRRLLTDGERVVVTHFTPAARREIAKVFGAEIAAGQLASVWVPFEYDLAYARFFRAFRPKYGLVMEVEFWPRMIASARARGVPLFLCNGQYPSKSYARDRNRLRGELVRGFAGVMVKNTVQRDRFLSLGMPDAAIRMTGEMRFDQPIPPRLTEAAQRLVWPGDRNSITFASVVEGEDDTYLDAIATLRAQAAANSKQPPRIVYVPRAPERFDTVAQMIAARGWPMARRSEALDANLVGDLDADILLGDSMGEMYFYLSLTEKTVVGGGFTPKGAHNVIEPLAVRKPVFVGPEIWTIEYPAQEAIEAGVLRHCMTEEQLAEALSPDAPLPGEAEMTAFFAAHAGGVDKTMAALPALLEHARAQGIIR